MIKTLKWWGTILCLVGIALTSLNTYPLNILFGFVGSGLWATAGYIQEDIPLLLVELIATVMYFIGIVGYIIYALIKWGLL